MPIRTRSLPDRKTLGTAYNLRPRTERVRASSLRPGDVVMESSDTPMRIARAVHTRLWTRLYARYVWQADREPTWLVGTFHPNHPFDRAVKGEC